MSFAPVVDALVAALPRATRPGLVSGEAWNVLVVAYLRHALVQLARARGADPSALAGGRLFQSVPGFEPDSRAGQRARLLDELSARPLPEPELPWAELPVEAFGQLYEVLLSSRHEAASFSLRKRTGSYYTPESLTRVVVERALDALAPLLHAQRAEQRPLKVLDPALGAGAFLVQVGRELGRRTGRPLAEVVRHELFGVDVSPLAVAVAEASLWLLAADSTLSLAQAGSHLHEGDALCEPGAAAALGRRGVALDRVCGDERGFDLVLGNPPWVAFAGRAAQPLPPALRAHYRATFRAFSGYPTLHALFVELSARAAPRGVVALLLPSPIADLDGYRPVRGVLAATHAVREPLLELGQDAFAGVTQPSFLLLAVPRTEPENAPERPFVLSERRRAVGTAGPLQTPPALERLGGLARLPAALFGEMGLQTNAAVTRELLHRGVAPPPQFNYALLEGRNVREFALGAPRLFLKPDRRVLEQYRCRLRAASDYERVKLVVRQTAAITIAAAHDGTPFRNSLLAGFELEDFPHFLTLGLLNSTLYRALHLAGRRDARQGAFPQVKIAHLRALPAPPAGAARARVAELSRRASDSGLTPSLRAELDAAVYDAFAVTQAEGVELARFVRELSPAAGLSAPLS